MMVNCVRVCDIYQIQLIYINNNNEYTSTITIIT